MPEARRAHHPLNPHRPPLSLRLKLTLWMLGVAALVHLTLGVVFHLYSARAGRDQMEQLVASRATAVAEALADQRPPFSANLVDSIREHEANSVFFNHLTVGIFDAGGEAVGLSGHAQVDRLVGLAGRALEARKPVRVGLRSADPELRHRRLDMFAAAQPFRAADGQMYAAVLASDLKYLAHRDRQITRMIAGMSLVGLFAVAIGGWHVAGRAVAPLRNIQEAARHISPETLDEGVEVVSSGSEVAQIEAELNRALRRIEEGYRAQARFLSNVSHELKTPIAVVLTEAQALKATGRLDPASEAFVDSTADEMRRLGRLVESFLMLTRIREGRQETDLRRCAVNDLVMASVEHCAAFAEHHGVGLAPSLLADEDELDLHVAGDPELLRTMLDNLVRNAVRFSPRAAAVAVDVCRQGEHVTIAVRDRGQGIPEEIIDRVFDRFVQAPGERSRGSGLGLEIAQGIAELHGGRIAAANNPGGGCEMLVRLPLASPPTAEGPAAQPHARGVAPDRRAPAGGEARARTSA